MKSIDVIGFFDDFAQRVTQPTLVVLYNASIHKSNEFKANIERWRKKDLFLYFLPPYSPELNKIEILWRKMKYQWISFDAFSSFKALKENLNQLIEQIGGNISLILLEYLTLYSAQKIGDIRAFKKIKVFGIS